MRRRASRSRSRGNLELDGLVAAHQPGQDRHGLRVGAAVRGEDHEQDLARGQRTALHGLKQTVLGQAQADAPQVAVDRAAAESRVLGDARGVEIQGEEPDQPAEIPLRELGALHVAVLHRASPRRHT